MLSASHSSPGFVGPGPAAGPNYRRKEVMRGSIPRLVWSLSGELPLSTRSIPLLGGVLIPVPANIYTELRIRVSCPQGVQGPPLCGGRVRHHVTLGAY